MNVSSLMLLLVLGVLSAVTVQGSPLIDDEGVIDNDSFDELFEDNEVVSIDEAIQKRKMLVKMAKLIEEAESMELTHYKKRFIEGFLDTIKKAMVKAAKKVQDFFTKTYNKAKEAFKKATQKINWTVALDRLEKVIYADETLAQCKSICLQGASYILGPAASVAGTVCTPLCEGGLAQLQEIHHKISTTDTP